MWCQTTNGNFCFSSAQGAIDGAKAYWNSINGGIGNQVAFQTITANSASVWLCPSGNVTGQGTGCGTPATFNLTPAKCPNTGSIWNNSTQSCGCDLVLYDLVGGQCVAKCPIGQARDQTGNCVQSCNTDQQSLGFGVAAGDSLSLGSTEQCVGGCMFHIVDIIDLGGGNNCIDKPDGSKTCYFDSNGTAQSCTGGAAGGNSASASGGGSSSSSSSSSATGGSSSTATTTAVNDNGTVTTTTVVTTTNANGSQSVVTNTNTTGGTSGTSASSGGTGVGNGGGTGTGSGSGSGSGAGQCDPTAVNYADCIAGTQSGLTHTQGTAASFGDAFNTFETGVKGTPLGSLAGGSGIGGAVNVGACPTATLSLFNQSIVMDSQCALYDSIAPTLAAVMHVVYVAMGILILLSA